MQDIERTKEKKIRKSSKSRTKLQIVLDPGTSLTKILYCLDDSRMWWMVMGGEYIALSKSYVDRLPKKDDLGLPEDNAWFQVSDSEECHLVGGLAKGRDIRVNVKNSKNLLLAERITAAIGAIAVKHGLKTKFDLRLGMLIPLNEVEEIKAIVNWKEDLKERLSNFTFQSEKVKANLKICQICPEGTGVILTNERHVRNSNTAIIMMGYRNTSCLFVKNKTVGIDNSGTSLLGFFQVIKKMKRKFSYIDEDSVMESINSTLNVSTIRPEYPIHCGQHTTSINFNNLIPINFSRDRDLEAKKIKEAYEEAVEEYWHSLVSWLEEILPSSSAVDRFLFSGGTSYLVEEQKKDLVNLYQAKLVKEEKCESLYKCLFYSKSSDLEHFTKQNYGVRFADAWGLFRSFAKYDYQNKELRSDTGKIS